MNLIRLVYQKVKCLFGFHTPQAVVLRCTDNNHNPIRSNYVKCRVCAKLLPGFVFYYHPDDYGAVRDGIADDAPAMQAAIDACMGSGIPLMIPNEKQ